jgi:hypothetical protein
VNEERIVAVVPQLNLDGAPRTVGDLVFTTRQVFLARRTGTADLARAFDATGGAPAAPRSRKSSQRLRAQSLDRILAAADRRTRFEYRELESITVNIGGLFSSPSVRFTPHHGRRVKLSGKRAALELLASAVPLLAAAGAPISLS